MFQVCRYLILLAALRAIAAGADYQAPYQAPPAEFQSTVVVGFQSPVAVPKLESLLQQVLQQIEHPSLIKQVVDGDVPFPQLVNDFEGNRGIYCGLYPATPECDPAEKGKTDQLVAAYRDAFLKWAGKQPRAPYGGGDGTVGPPVNEPGPAAPAKPIIGACWSQFFCGPGPGAWDVVKNGEVHEKNGKHYRASVSFGFGGKQIVFELIP